MFRGVPVLRSVPVFRCSGVPGFSTCPYKQVILLFFGVVVAVAVVIS